MSKLNHKAVNRQGRLVRYYTNQKSFLGSLQVKNKAGETIAHFYTMEPPWKDNKRNVSCITPGVYLVLPHTSPKFGDCFKVYELDGSEVNGRSEILFHVGNYATNTDGCICPGMGTSDINKDGLMDVVQSRVAMNNLARLIEDGMILQIIQIHE